ncbi:MAG TPA: serine hydrolase domain-containing protein [Mycobacteriales bacterium]|nr:serine hydrolase domain-containing protein [Mycobacteriales bacterium]
MTSGRVLLAVVEGEKVQWRSLGLSSRGLATLDVPSLDQTVPMPVGSISKVITAIALARLARTGQLDLEEPASVSSPKAPHSKPSIRDLLAHSGGISPVPSMRSEKRVLALPGTQWCYSEPGYRMAIRHAERVTGYNIRDLILEQLPMLSSYDVDAQRFRGHEVIAGTRLTVPPIRPATEGAGWACHGIIASPAQLVAIARSLLADRPILNALAQPYGSEVGVNPFQGLGFRITYAPGGSWAIHGGQWLGYHTIFAVGATKSLLLFSDTRFRRPVLRCLLKRELTDHTAGSLPITNQDWSPPPFRISSNYRFAAAGPLALTAAMHVAHGRQLQVRRSSDGTLQIAARNQAHRLSQVDSRGLWSYTIKGEPRLISLSGVPGGFRLVTEQPCCVFSEVD